MPRPRTPDSDEDAEEGLAELEMQKLSRQLRIMEGDRDAYTQETQNLIRKQKNEIDQLESEKKEVVKDLRLAESRANQSSDEGNAEILTAIMDAREEKTREIEEERDNMEKLTTEQKDWEKKIKVQHKKMGGVHMSAAYTAKVQKNVRTLENRLEKALRKFNSMLTGNADLRTEIDSLRVERKRYEGMYKKLEKELTSLRKEISDQIDASTQAYDGRDEAQAKMILLKERADKDLQQHNAEMKELIRILDHDRKLREFMGIKGQERQEDEDLVARQQEKEKKDARLKKESQEDSVETYDRAMEIIRRITGEEDYDMLVKKFIEVEDRNFALFNYVNEQHNEIEAIHEQIQAIRDEIEHFRAQGVELEQQRKQILKQLEEDQVKASKDADDLEEQLKTTNKILDQLKAGVDSLFNKINCDRGVIDDMLGAKTGVSDQTMLQYLGIVEQRTNELLAVRDYQHSKDYEKYDPRAPGLIGVGPKPPPQPSHIVAPSVGDEIDVEEEPEEDDGRPMTRSELHNKVMKTVRKRESAMMKEGFRYDLSNARDKTKKK